MAWLTGSNSSRQLNANFSGFHFLSEGGSILV